MMSVRRLVTSYPLWKHKSCHPSPLPSTPLVRLSNRMFSSHSSDDNKSSWKRLPSRGWSPTTTVNTTNNKPKNKPAPVNFGKNFTIPKLEPHENILATTNVYPLDSRVTGTFVDKKEQYSIDGNVTDLSVAEVVDEFFEKFDADETIEKMMNGPRWPRDGYVWPNKTPFTAAEIKKKWNNTGDYVKNRDIWMRHNIERHFNQLEMIPSKDKSTDDQFLSFNKEVVEGNQLQPHRASWPIVAPDLGLAGSVDFAARFPDGTMAIFLWRQSKTLADNLISAYGKRGQYPIEHLEDCEGSKCYLQLSFLKYILEKYYGLTVSNMIVVAFHTEMDSYYLQEAPLLSKEVTDILAEIKRRQSEDDGTADNIPSAAATAAKNEDDNSWSEESNTSSHSSSSGDNGNESSSQSNPSPSLRRDNDIPF